MDSDQMQTDFIDLATRRAMFWRAVSLAAGTTPCRPPGADHPDERLLAACVSFNRLEREKIELIASGEPDVCGVLVSRLHSDQAFQLEAMSRIRPMTPDGHRSRALAFQLWNGGELAFRARVGRDVEDCLLAAIVRDLADGRPAKR